jgi:hypothetical protein
MPASPAMRPRCCLHICAAPAARPRSCRCRRAGGWRAAPPGARLRGGGQPRPQRLHGHQRADGVDLKVLPQARRVHVRQRVQVLVAGHHQQQRHLRRPSQNPPDPHAPETAPLWPASPGAGSRPPAAAAPPADTLSKPSQARECSTVASEPPGVRSAAVAAAAPPARSCTAVTAHAGSTATSSCVQRCWWSSARCQRTTPGPASCTGAEAQVHAGDSQAMRAHLLVFQRTYDRHEPARYAYVHTWASQGGS